MKFKEGDIVYLKAKVLTFDYNWNSLEIETNHEIFEANSSEVLIQIADEWKAELLRKAGHDQTIS